MTDFTQRMKEVLDNLCFTSYCMGQDYEKGDNGPEKVSQLVDQILADLTVIMDEMRIDGMEQAKSCVLRRTEIAADAKNPTRDAIVILGEEIADIIQRDINALEYPKPSEDTSKETI